jgi:hypothetical protein
MLDAMIELLRLPEIQRIIAMLAAIASGCISFRVAVLATMAYAIKRAPHDGQAGLGALFMGLMIGVLIAGMAYGVSFHFMQNWEKRYTKRLDEKDRLRTV